MYSEPSQLPRHVLNPWVRPYIPFASLGINSYDLSTEQQYILREHYFNLEHLIFYQDSNGPCCLYWKDIFPLIDG